MPKNEFLEALLQKYSAKKNRLLLGQGESLSYQVLDPDDLVIFSVMISSNRLACLVHKKEGSREKYPIRIFDIENGEQCTELKKIHSTVDNKIFVLSEERLAFRKEWNSVILYDLKSNKIISEIKIKQENNDHIINLFVLPEGNLISLEKNEKKVKDYDFSTRNYRSTGNYYNVRERNITTHWVRCLDKKDGKRIWNQCTGFGLNKQTVVVGLSNTQIALTRGDKSHGIEILDAKSYKTLKGHTDKVTIIITLPSGLLASASEDKTIKIWDVEKAQCIETIEIDGHIKKLIMFNDLLISLHHVNKKQSTGKVVMVWDTDTWQCLQTIDQPENFPDFSAILTDGRFLALKNDQAMVYGKSSQKHDQLVGHGKRINCAVELNEQLIATGSDDRTIKIWDFKTGKCIKTLIEHEYSVKKLSLLSGNQFASVGDSIKIWDMKNWKCLKTLSGVDLLELPQGILREKRLLILNAGKCSIDIYETHGWQCIKKIKCVEEIGEDRIQYFRNFNQHHILIITKNKILALNLDTYEMNIVLHKREIFGYTHVHEPDIKFHDENIKCFDTLEDDRLAVTVVERYIYKLEVEYQTKIISLKDINSISVLQRFSNEYLIGVENNKLFLIRKISNNEKKDKYSIIIRDADTGKELAVLGKERIIESLNTKPETCAIRYLPENHIPALNSLLMHPDRDVAFYIFSIEASKLYRVVHQEAELIDIIDIDKFKRTLADFSYKSSGHKKGDDLIPASVVALDNHYYPSTSGFLLNKEQYRELIISNTNYHIPVVGNTMEIKKKIDTFIQARKFFTNKKDPYGILVEEDYITVLDKRSFYQHSLTRLKKSDNYFLLNDKILITEEQGDIKVYKSFPLAKSNEQTRNAETNKISEEMFPIFLQALKQQNQQLDQCIAQQEAIEKKLQSQEETLMQQIGNINKSLSGFLKIQEQQSDSVNKLVTELSEINKLVKNIHQQQKALESKLHSQKQELQTFFSNELEAQKQNTEILSKVAKLQDQRLKSCEQEIKELKQQITDMVQEDGKTEQIFFDQMLLTAAKQGRKQKVKHALEMDANINACDKNGYTAFHLSVLNGHEEIINLLLELFPNLLNDAKDLDKGQTALHMMAAAGNIHMVKLLLEKNADHTLEDSLGQTPYDVATKETQIAIANKILFNAAKIGDKDLAEKALKKGAEINAKTPHHRETALHIAVYHKYNELVKFLLDCGANASESNARGETPYKYVESYQDEELKTVLADKNLIIAVKNNNINGVIDLLSSGANVGQAVDEQGLSALHWAVRNKNKEIITLLLSKNAKIDIADKDGQIPLHWAATSNDKEVIDLLLNQHLSLQIDIKVKNRDGYTPTQLANRLNGEEWSDYILEQWGHLKGVQKMQLKLEKKTASFLDYPQFSFVSKVGSDSTNSVQSTTLSSEKQQIEEDTQTRP